MQMGRLLLLFRDRWGVADVRCAVVEELRHLALHWSELNPTAAIEILHAHPIFVHVDLPVLGRLRLLRLRRRLLRLLRLCLCYHRARWRRRWRERSRVLSYVYESGDKQSMCRAKEALAVLGGTYSIEL